MTQLPFEDLPEPFAGWNEFWQTWPNKAAKKTALRAYSKALRRTSPDEILYGARWFLRNKPDWMSWPHASTWLNADRWNDVKEAVVVRVNGSPTPESLAIIAAHVNRSFCERGKYDRETLQACVDAGLLTVEQMEDKL